MEKSLTWQMQHLREEFIIIEKGGGRGKEGEKIKRKGRERGKAEVCTAHGEKGSKWGGRRRERFLKKEVFHQDAGWVPTAGPQGVDQNANIPPLL